MERAHWKVRPFARWVLGQGVGWVEEQFVGDGGVEAFENSQVVFGVVAFAKAGDDDALHFGQVLDDAPGGEGVAIGHG